MFPVKHILQLFQLIPFWLMFSTVWAVGNDLGNGVVSGKYFWFYLSIGLTAATVALSRIFSRTSFRFVRLDAWIFLFCLSGPAGAYFHSGAVSTKCMLLFLLFAAYLYFRYLLSERGRFNSYCLSLFLMITGLAEAVWGLAQLHGFCPSQHSLFNLTGSFFNPGPYAGWLAMCLPIAFYFLLADYPVFGKRRRRRYAAFYVRWGCSALAFVMILLALPAAMSRASWIAAAGGCALAGGLYLKRKKGNVIRDFLRKNRKKAITAAIFLSLVLLLLPAGMYRLKKDSADGRRLIWKISLQTIAEHPLGVGLGRFAGSYGEQQAARFASGKASAQERQVAGSPEYGFNEYLQICVEWGIAPFCLFIGILAGLFRAGLRRKRHAAVGALAALMIFAGMSYPLNVLPFVIAWVFLAAVCVLENVAPGTECSSEKRRRATSILLVALSAATLLCAGSRRASYEAYRQWKGAEWLYRAEAWLEAAAEYARCCAELKDEIRFLFEYARILNKTGQYGESSLILQQAMHISCDPMLHNMAGLNHQALERYREAEDCFTTAALLVPGRHYPHYLLMLLYAETAQREKAVEQAGILLTQPVKIPSEAIREMKQEAEKIIRNDH